MDDKIYLNNSEAFDLPTLIETKLLIQANSGGGKSFAIRRILEQSYGKTQQFVIDLEGEFSTLREKYDYILAGKDGDLPISAKTAELLARRLLELNVSTILDLSELNPNERRHYVRLFLESMINAPKELWHSVLVVIDEAHIFCPQNDPCESSEAVINLATRGRKRGYCAILATQRLAKLHKDAAAECNNKMIGRTTIDLDLKRARNELDFTSKDKLLTLRNLEPGEFYVFGPAISQEVREVKIGDVQTSHPKAGSRFLTSSPAPPTEKIKRILAELKDLPQEAQEEAKTVEDLRRQIVNLKKENTLLKAKSEPLRVAPTADQINDAVNFALQKQKTRYEREIKNLEAQANKLRSALKSVRTTIANTLQEPEYETKVNEPEIKAKVAASPTPNENSTVEIQENSLPEGAARMLKKIATLYPLKLTKTQLGTLLRFDKQGDFYNSLSTLRSREFITIENDRIGLTQEGLKSIGIPIERMNASKLAITIWQETLSGKALNIFNLLVSEYPRSFTRQEIAKKIEMSAQGGAFHTYLSMLKNNELLEVEGSKIKASENLFKHEDGKRAA